VLGGMLLATVLGVVFVPVFFVLVERLGWSRKPER
jgi:multidrug efflux pump subunit AcrB